MGNDKAQLLISFAIVLANGSPDDVKRFLTDLYRANPAVTQVDLPSIVDSLGKNISAARTWVNRFTNGNVTNDEAEPLQHQAYAMLLNEFFKDGVRPESLHELYRRAKFPMTRNRPNPKPAHIEAIAEFLEKEDLVETYKYDSTHIKMKRRRTVAHLLGTSFIRRLDKVLSNGKPNMTYINSYKTLHDLWVQDQTMKAFWIDRIQNKE